MWGDLGRTAIRFWPLPTCSAPPLPFFLAVLLCSASNALLTFTFHSAQCP